MKAEERKREKYLPTLLIQQIRLQWYKDCRGGNGAVQRNQYPKAMRLPKDFFSYLPFGNWNDCPDTPDLMAAAKYWFEQYGAVPAAMSHDELEFLLPAPVPKEKAMDVAVLVFWTLP